MTTTVNIIRNRVDGADVSGATVDSEGGNVVLQFPGEKDPGALIRLIGTTAQLYFRPVLCGAPTYRPPAKGKTAPTGPLPSCGRYATTAASLARERGQRGTAASRGRFRTVLAADLVSLAATVVLDVLAVGTVRGFAFFLGLSTLLDVFTAFFFTRPLVILLGRSTCVTGARFIGVARGLALGGESTVSNSASNPREARPVVQSSC